VIDWISLRASLHPDQYRSPTMAGPSASRLFIVVMVGVIAAAVLIIAERNASSKVQVDCMDPTEREKVRDIVLNGIDQGLEKSIVHLFDIWTKDMSDQPRRAMVGTNNAVNAHARARKQALAWDPPACQKENQK
jgi:hypothetical protein